MSIIAATASAIQEQATESLNATREEITMSTSTPTATPLSTAISTLSSTDDNGKIAISFSFFNRAIALSTFDATVPAKDGTTSIKRAIKMSYVDDSAVVHSYAITFDNMAKAIDHMVDKLKEAFQWTKEQLIKVYNYLVAKFSKKDVVAPVTTK